MAVYFALATIIGLYGTAIHANTDQRRRKRFVIVAFASAVSICKRLLSNCSRGIEKARGGRINAKSRKSHYYGGRLRKSNAPGDADNTETAG